MSSKRILDIRRPEKGKAAKESRARARISMSSLFSQKPKRLRDRRRRQRLLMFSICILCAAGAVGGLGFASHAERLAIKDISVTGAREISPQALSAAVAVGLEEDSFRLFSRENIFLYPRRAIEETLADSFPRIKEVELSRPAFLAQAVVVSVEERQPFAKWCAETCYLLDEAGFIFDEAGTAQPMTPYVFRAGLLPDESPVGQWFLRGRLRETVRLLELLKAAGYEAEGIQVENQNDFSVSLVEGPTLRVPFSVESEKVVRDLQLALGAETVRDRVNELEYVDLRFGNRVYYKFKGE